MAANDDDGTASLDPRVEAVARIYALVTLTLVIAIAGLRVLRCDDCERRTAAVIAAGSTP